MHTFDILLQQIGLFIIYILAGVILVRTRVLSRETLEPISKFVLKMDQFMLWTLGVKLLSPEGEGRFALKKLVNPATVAILLGMILMLAQVRIPALLDTALQKIGSTASPLAMIYVGGIFAGISFRRYIREISLYGIVLVRMIVAPILLFLILGIFPVGEEIRMAMALIVGMPTMTAVIMMANASGLDGDYALGGVFVTTVCGIMTLPMVCWISHYRRGTLRQNNCLSG